MREPEPLTVETPPRIGDLIGEAGAICQRVTGKTPEEWEEIFWKRRAKAVRTGKVGRNTVWLSLSEITAELGLEGDDFIADWHDFDYVMQYGQNARHVRRMYHIPPEVGLTKTKYFRYNGQEAKRMIAYKIKPEVFDVLERTVNLMSL